MDVEILLTKKQAKTLLRVLSKGQFQKLKRAESDVLEEVAIQLVEDVGFPD
jgi:hypothetical protein